MLPLFPLGLVLVPGQVLPLHVFEPRYRALVRDLLALPEDRRELGVVAIRAGSEVGVDGVRALWDVGCTAQLHRVHEHEDGRYDVVTVGRRPFRLLSVAEDRPYLTGEVAWLPDEVGDADAARTLDPAVRRELRRYLTALSASSGEDAAAPDLPGDPVALGHAVAATLLLDVADRQALLDQPDGATRLRRVLAVLRRECALLDELSAVPAPQLARTPYGLS